MLKPTISNQMKPEQQDEGPEKAEIDGADLRVAEPAGQPIEKTGFRCAFVQAAAAEYRLRRAATCTWVKMF
jgi:hypothetical protein